jgi:hypothetical protein
MRTLSVILNVSLSVFTVFVLGTDGIPTEPHLVALSLLFILVPALSAPVIGRVSATRPQSHRTRVGRELAISFNVVLLCAALWAFVTRFPSHPSEPGLVPYVVLTLGVPVVSLLVLRRHGREAAGDAVVTK